MKYDNKKYCDLLNDKDQTIAFAKAGLDDFRKEAISDRASDWAKSYIDYAKIHYARCINIIWSCAESPLERIFMSALLMNFIRNQHPLGIVVTYPMQDAIKNMDEMRSSIAEMQSAFQERKAKGFDTSLPTLLQELEVKINKGKIPEEERDIHQQMFVCYHFLELTNVIHLTPQAVFPNARSKRKNIRADLLFWVPDFSDLCIIGECDSYQYHDNKKSFNSDRQRSRALQDLGFKVLQYSGGEIYSDPIHTSFELYNHLCSELERHSKISGKDLHPHF